MTHDMIIYYIILIISSISLLALFTNIIMYTIGRDYIDDQEVIGFGIMLSIPFINIVVLIEIILYMIIKLLINISTKIRVYNLKNRRKYE